MTYICNNKWKEGFEALQKAIEFLGPFDSLGILAAMCRDKAKENEPWWTLYGEDIHIHLISGTNLKQVEEATRSFILGGSKQWDSWVKKPDFSNWSSGSTLKEDL